MSLIEVVNLAKTYGPVDIFSGITFSLPKAGRQAIVGPNGIGKTTLLRILAGEEPPSGGQVNQARFVKLGYLPQEASFDSNRTLWDECLSAFDELLAQEAELARLEAAMSDPAQSEQAMERYGAIQHAFEHRGGYTYPLRIQQVLSGLGFSEGEFHDPLAHLSGGQRTRALLARLLLSDPDLLILDEPTNHLDIQAVEWLEGYLSQWDGAALIVSHDRYFLDQVANTIYEMSRNGFETYRGNYSAYVQQRQQRWDQRYQLFQGEKERMEKELEYVRKNISGQRTLQAKGKLRRLSRQLEAIESLGVEAVLNKSWGVISEEADIAAHAMGVEEATRRLHALKEPNNRPPNLRLHLKTSQRSGNIILRTQDIQVGYPGRPLFRAEDIELHRLETAAMIGPNGAGKTTFLRTILGQIQPLSGQVTLGASLQIGYFAQAHEGLDPENTLVQEIEKVSPNLLLAEIRKYLARFLFSGDEVFKKVGVLSGGERGRLALAQLALTNANLLLLDEPTNHLDIPSQEILQTVLDSYEGTILLVSHDRYLIDALASQVWEIDENKGELTVFKGSYSQYHALQEAQREAEKSASQQEHKALQGANSRRDNRAQLEERRRKAQLEALENRIGELEAELSYLSRALENPPADQGKVQKLGSDYVRLEKQLEQLLVEWEGLNA